MEIGMTRSEHSREYLCGQCSSVVAAAPVFRHLLGDRMFASIWNAPSPSGIGPPCSFCAVAMQRRSLEAGHAAVCHTCQVLWFDRGALESLPAAESTSALAEVAMAKCPCCGAPVSATVDGCCRYCGTTIESADTSPSPV